MKIYDVLGNSQRLDGGALFGNAPKALWGRWLEPDEQNRIAIACRALLVDTGEERILLETGIGCFFPPQLRERYGVVEDDHRLLASLNRLGVSEADIDAVVLSHLHFDHAGGLLSRYDEAAPMRLHFPNARYLVGAGAFARAEAPHPRDRASFIPELPQLLRASGRLQLLPDEVAESPYLPAGFRLSRSFGHTPAMLHTELRGAKHSVFFCADLIPGRAWIHAPITMGYDRFAEAVIDEKLHLLPRFESEQTWLYFTHDPEVAAARVAANKQRRFAPTDVRTTFPDGWDLDAD